jgi:CRP/FNR family cyclic AMP-dependent transcriptional regulator
VGALTHDLVSTLQLYRNLAPTELDEVAPGLWPVAVDDGQTLMRQGDEPDGAYFLTAGMAQVFTRLPGGGETLIAEVGPGAMLGELALIRSAPRGATVRAQGPVEALFVDRRYFLATLAQLRPAAIKVSRNLSMILAQRLHQLHERIVAHVTAAPESLYFTALPAPEDAPADGPGFDARAFLPALPCFREFASSELDRIATLAPIVHAARGTPLDGDAPAGGWIVVRGAVMACLPHEDGAHQLSVLGPGSFCALDRLIAPEAVRVRHVARERAVLLTVSEPAFRELFEGGDSLALRFVVALNEGLASQVARGGNHLTRLVGLARLYRQREDASGLTI